VGLGVPKQFAPQRGAKAAYLCFLLIKRIPTPIPHKKSAQALTMVAFVVLSKLRSELRFTPEPAEPVTRNGKELNDNRRQ
jgi:hypothetical protein